MTISTARPDNLLESPALRDHFVEVYDEHETLVRSVTLYAERGLAAGQGIVIIATPQMRERLRESARIMAAIHNDRAVFLDAAETLSKFMRAGRPDEALFQAQVKPVISALAARFGRVRAFGEMVNLLWQEGNRPGAIRLEEMWNALLAQHDFSLFCAYRMDSLDEDLEQVCKTHTHLLPTDADPELEALVSKACEDRFGKPLAKIMRGIAGAGRTRARIPPARAFVMWLRRNMPASAEEIVADLRRRRSRPSSNERPGVPGLGPAEA